MIATVFLTLSACSTTVSNVVPKTDVKSGTYTVSTGDTASRTSESSQNSISQPSQSLGSQQGSEVNGKECFGESERLLKFKGKLIIEIE